MKIRAKSPINHDGTLYGPGDGLDVEESVARDLIDNEVAEPAPVEEGRQPDPGDPQDSESTDAAETEDGPVPQDLLMACHFAIEEGKVTKDNKPTIDFLEERLRRKVTAEERDRALEQLEQEKQE